MESKSSIENKSERLIEYDEAVLISEDEVLKLIQDNEPREGNVWDLLKITDGTSIGDLLILHLRKIHEKNNEYMIRDKSTWNRLIKPYLYAAQTGNIELIDWLVGEQYVCDYCSVQYLENISKDDEMKREIRSLSNSISGKIYLNDDDGSLKEDILTVNEVRYDNEEWGGIAFPYRYAMYKGSIDIMEYAEKMGIKIDMPYDLCVLGLTYGELDQTIFNFIIKNKNMTGRVKKLLKDSGKEHLIKGSGKRVRQKRKDKSAGADKKKHKRVRTMQT